MKILLIEDDEDTASFIKAGLSEHGHSVDRVADGREGLALLTTGTYEAAVIDRMVPGLDGLTVVKKARTTGLRTPVIFLSTLSGVGDRVKGLEAGGDDYLIKPFAFVELLARINALGRRSSLSETPMVLRVGELEMDLLKRTVTRATQPIVLHPREFRLLEYLMRNADRLVTRTMLLENVWDIHFDPHTNVVETHMSRLRSKVDRGFAYEMINTTRGSGYTLRAPE